MRCVGFEDQSVGLEICAQRHICDGGANIELNQVVQQVVQSSALSDFPDERKFETTSLAESC